MHLTSVIWLLFWTLWASPEPNDLANFFDAQSPESYVGAWISEGDDKGRPLTRILIVTDRYFTTVSFTTKDNHFLYTSGGTYAMQADKMSVTIEYHSPDHYQVGKQHVLHAKPTETGYKLVARDGMVLGDWKRIDAGSKSQVAGLWYARSFLNEKGDTVQTTYKVRTLKILSDTRFQWVAFDTISRKFLATAGGTYSITPSGYTENIEFYSEGEDKIGKSLGFKYKLEDNRWAHSGKSSAGMPLYELWTKR